MEDKFLYEVLDPKRDLKNSGREFTYYDYPYTFTMKDRVYVSTLRDKSIVDQCIQSALFDHAGSLAGDIEDEKIIRSHQVGLSVAEELKWHLSNMANQPITYVDLNGDSNPPSPQVWVNKQKQYEFNPAHDHTGMFSFVIYGDISEEIRQEHLKSKGNTRLRGLIQFSSDLTSEGMAVNPSKYDILIFESSHTHQVYPFYSDNVRVSIAGNVYDAK
jgi:hypothetical protein